MKAQRDQLRERMRGYGCTVGQIAAELGRRFNLRPRLAWWHALGWPQWKLALRYNTAHPGARLSDRQVSERENWPHGGSPPSLHYLATWPPPSATAAPPPTSSTPTTWPS